MRTRLHPRFNNVSSSFALLAAVVLFTVTAPAPAQTSWGNALYFNHTGLVNAAIPTLANNYTFSAWVYLTWGGNTWSSSALGVLSAYCGQSAEVIVSSQTLSSTDPQYLWFTRCGSFSAAYSTLTVPLNEWVHIAVTVSPSGLVSYFINGNAAGSWNAGGYNVSIGPGITLADSVHRSFYGMLDEVQIWNTARTQAQIAADMTHPLTGAEPNLVACYHFDEGAGTTVHDATANHLDGTMTTGPVWVASTVDTNPPVITCPTNQVVVAAPGECGTNVTFAATATDNLDPAPTVTCVPPSGFAFPVGRTTVLCTAADTSGNSNTCSFTVSVYPAVTNLPTILGATNQVLEAAGPTGAPASFNVTATNLCQPNVPVTCTPPSGSTFPLGTNTVTCVAVDALGVTNSASFTLTVCARRRGRTRSWRTRSRVRTARTLSRHPAPDLSLQIRTGTRPGPPRWH